MKLIQFETYNVISVNNPPILVNPSNINFMYKVKNEEEAERALFRKLIRKADKQKK